MSLVTKPDPSCRWAAAPIVKRPCTHELVRAATLAPSPDNNQPWRFVAGEGMLDVLLDRSRALPSDVNSMFDLTALGAAIENICIAAREDGFEPSVEPLYEEATSAAVRSEPVGARIAWRSGGNHDRLFPYLGKRHTSRRPYRRESVDSAILQKLSSEADSFPEVQVHWLTDRRAIRSFAWLVGQSDRLRFERKSFHQELFRQLRFSPAEAESTRDGLDLRALALPPLGGLVLRLIKNWRVLAMANWFGASRMLALPSVRPVMQCGAIGLLNVDEPTWRCFASGGRAFQRIWLAATAEGLQLHPLGSLPIFLAHLEQLGGQELTASQQRLAKKVRDRFHRIAPHAVKRVLQIGFRLGKGVNASCRSLRRDVSTVLHESSTDCQHAPREIA